MPRSLPAALMASARRLAPSWQPLAGHFGGLADAQLQLLVCSFVGLRALAPDELFSRELALSLVDDGEHVLDRFLAAALRGLTPEQRAELDALSALLSQTEVAAWLAQAHEPLLELYEPFLLLREPNQRRRHGVYYTPPALAAHVVERVDTALVEELGVPLGLADCRTFRELGLPSATPECHAVRILDPAAGTGVFLSQVIARVFARVRAQHLQQGLTQEQARAAWQRYVPGALLPRLLGFELLPVPAALAQLQLRAALARTGYMRCKGDPPVVVQVDALRAFADYFTGASSSVGTGLSAAQPISVVVGNPPYARGGRTEKGVWDTLMQDYKVSLHAEKNLQPLADDYLRFVRASERLLQDSPVAVAGLVTSATYLDGHLFRDMRASLMRSFPRIDVVDLGGSSKHLAPVQGGARDENVFGIATGVAAAILRRGPTPANARVRYWRLRGQRVAKLAALAELASTPAVEHIPSSPEQRFTPERDLPPEYADFLALDQLFASHSIGAKPGDDAHLVAFDAATAREQLVRLQLTLQRQSELATSEAARKLQSLGALPEPLVTRPYAYRPFDTRSVCDVPAIWSRPVHRLRALQDGGPSLLATRFARDGAFAHVFASRLLSDVIFLSNRSSVNSFVFPESALCVERLGQAPQGQLSRAGAFAYLYAALHSRSYRQRYAAGLSTGFARVPRAPAGPLSAELVACGQRLLALHLMDAALDPATLPRFVGQADRRIERSFATRRELRPDAHGHVTVTLNATAAFEAVPLACWSFRVGSYQVCHKWLLDRLRAGRALSDADVQHYARIVATLSATLSCMDEIDHAIERHGGWPRAFTG